MIKDISYMSKKRKDNSNNSSKPIKRFVISILICVLSLGYIIYDTWAEHQSQILVNDLADKHSNLLNTLGTSESTETEIAETDINSVDASLNEIAEEAVVTAKDLIIIDTPVDEEEIEQVEEKPREPLRVLDSIKPFYIENQDTVGWLTLGGTRIDNVVVQGNDNSYYLDHNFNRAYSQPGTLFVDYRCNITNYSDLQSDNIIIYGHKQKSGSMFGTLHNYHNDIDFFKEHPTFTFSNLYETYEYRIIAMFVCKTKDTLFTEGTQIFDYQNYINFQDSGDYTFSKFMSHIKSRSELNIPVSVSPKDKYMILSTCSYEFAGARFVVVARRARVGETLDLDMEHVSINKYRQT